MIKNTIVSCVVISYTLCLCLRHVLDEVSAQVMGHSDVQTMASHLEVSFDFLDEICTDGDVSVAGSGTGFSFWWWFSSLLLCLF